MNFDFSCDLGHIKLDVPYQMWEAITSDGNANTLVTRFFHNTPSFYASNLLKCYLSYFSPEFINQNFSLLGLVLSGIGLWYVVTSKRWKVLLLILAAPLSPLLDFPSNGLWQVVILSGAVFLVIFFGVKSVWQYFSGLKKKFC